MPDYIVETPEGRFTVTAPDPESAATAFKAFKGGGGGPAAPPKFAPAEEAYVKSRTEMLNSRDAGSILPQGLRDFAEQAKGAVPGANALFDAASAAFDGPKDATFGRTYDLNREARRRRTEELRNRSPIGSTAGEIVGGVAALPGAAASMPAAVMRGAAGAGAVPIAGAAAPRVGGMLGGEAAGGVAQWAAGTRPVQAVSGVLGRVTSPATGGGAVGRLAENTINGALVGGTQAAVQEYGYGNDPGDAFVGGAVIGGALPGVIGGAGKVAGFARDVTQAFTNPDAAAYRRMLNSTPTGRTPESLVERALRTGNGAMPIDFANKSGRVSMRAAINAGTQEGDNLIAKLGVRQMGAPSRVSRSMAANAGADPSASAGAFNIRLEQMRKAGEQGYEAAEAAARPVDLTPTINLIDERLGPAARIAGPSTVKDTPIERALRSIRDMLGNAREQRFDLRTLHRFVKREIDSAVEAARPTAFQKGDRVLYSELKDISDQFVKDLGKDNDLYNVARRQWAGDMAAIDAYNAGLEYFSSKGSNINARDMARFSQADREMLKAGMVRSVQDWIEQGVDGADISKRIMGSVAKRNALSELFDTPREQARFFTDLVNEGRFARTRAKAIGGSQTDELAKEGQNALVDIATGSPITSMLKRAAAFASGWPPALASSFIRIMSDTSLTGLQRNQRLLQAAAGNRRMYEQMRQAAVKLGRSAGAGAVQSGEGDN